MGATYGAVSVSLNPLIRLLRAQIPSANLVRATGARDCSVNILQAGCYRWQQTIAYQPGARKFIA
jgi:hypothetical protein